MLLHIAILLVILPETNSRRGGGSRGSGRTSSRTSSRYNKPTSYNRQSTSYSNKNYGGTSNPTYYNNKQNHGTSYTKPRDSYSGSNSYKNKYGNSGYGGVPLAGDYGVSALWKHFINLIKSCAVTPGSILDNHCGFKDNRAAGTVDKLTKARLLMQVW